MRKTYTFITLLFIAGILSGQTIIKGKITDLGTGEPLIGANVYVKNTFQGTVTDIEGNYILELSPDVSEKLVKIRVAYTGFIDGYIQIIDDGRLPEFVKDLANFILNILWVVFHGLIIISEKTYDGTLHSLCQEERLPFNLCIDSRWGVTGRVHHFPMGSLMASLFHLLKAHSQTLSLLW